jgi:hypothetical protein
MEFFPPGALDDRPDLHAFHDRWYVSHLLSMREQPLHPPAAEQPDSYRLLFLPTFQRPSVVHLNRVGEAWKAVCKQTDGRGGYGPGQLTMDEEHYLSPVEEQKFVQLLDRAKFWEMPSFEDSAGLDGSRAVLEGVRAAKYHVVDRWSPRGTPYAKLVEFLLKLGDG